MIKRVFLFVLTNILVVTLITTITHLLGLRPYLSAYGIDYTQLAIFCLIWGMGGAFISLQLSRFMAKTMMGVKLVSPQGEYAALVQRVYSLARKAGLTTMPEVGIYHSPEINAFATGPSKSRSLVAVSTGLLERMDSDEVEGVLGHEVAHIANGDMVTMTLLQGVINAFVMFLARVIAFAIDQALRSSDRDGERSAGLGGLAHFAVVIVLELFFGLLGAMVVNAFSRWREFRADKGGARLAGKEKMVAALRSLQRNFQVNASVPQTDGAFQNFKISTGGKKWLALFSSHPPLEERIKALETATSLR